MALSNWDTLAVDETGKSTNGVFESPLDVQVAIYKNWLYVYDEKAWRSGGSFVEPTVMEIREGHVRYQDVDIIAKRGPQNGIYCVVQSTVYPPALTEDCVECAQRAKSTFHARTCSRFVDVKHIVMIGCGVYGYDDDGWIGVTQESREHLAQWIHASELRYYPLQRASDDTRPDEAVIADFATRGDTVVMHAGELQLQIVHYDFDQHVRDINLSHALRFNQGDAYFAQHLGTETPATPPGKSDPSLLMQILKSERSSKDVE